MSTETPDIGVIYIMSNPAMPGLLKIGYSRGLDADTRAAQLFTTGVPFPFDVDWECYVEHPQQYESLIHKSFADCRVHKDREFFRIDNLEALRRLSQLLWPSDDGDKFDLPTFMEKWARHNVRFEKKYPTTAKNRELVESWLAKILELRTEFKQSS